MTDYKFSVGSTVQVSRRSLSGQSAVGSFKVLARYPSESSGPMYRVRSVLGQEERMVPEHELSMAPQPANNNSGRTPPRSGIR